MTITEVSQAPLSKVKRMTTTRTNTVILAVAVFILSVISLPARAAPDDRYLAGYAAAILETRFGLPSRELQVENGKLRLHSADLQGQDTGEVLASLRAIDGLEVELVGPSTEARSVSSSAKPTAAAECYSFGNHGMAPAGGALRPLDRRSALAAFFGDPSVLPA
jgi:hypothetical protein